MGMFKSHEEIDEFCENRLSLLPSVKSIKYVIENTQNLIVLFESDLDVQTMSNQMYKFLTEQNIKFYFIFKRDDIVTAFLPQEVKKFLFNSDQNENKMFINYKEITNSVDEEVQLDVVLDKIRKGGVKILTSKEKNFLDNFQE
jgi:esterase/lipase superfamily enzyme